MRHFICGFVALTFGWSANAAEIGTESVASERFGDGAEWTWTAQPVEVWLHFSPSSVWPPDNHAPSGLEVGVSAEIQADSGRLRFSSGAFIAQGWVAQSGLGQVAGRIGVPAPVAADQVTTPVPYLILEFDRELRSGWIFEGNFGAVFPNWGAISPIESPDNLRNWPPGATQFNIGAIFRF